MARTWADIARAAFEVLVNEGSDAVTHARVAEIAGYSKTTRYSHRPARSQLIAVAVDALGDLPHHQRSGDLRSDLIGELQVFREAVDKYRLHRVLAGMARWATVEEMRQIRDKFGSLPEDDTIASAVDIVLRSARRRR